MYNLEVDGNHDFFVGGSSWLVHNARPCWTPGEIALGKDIPGGGMKALSEFTNAPWYRKWEEAGVTRRTVDTNFGRAFNQAVDRSERVHFSLDGMGDIDAAFKAGRLGFVQGNMTNAELRAILSNPDWLSKTTFYRTINGQITPVTIKP